MISCLMATGGRPKFLEQAIRYFLRQSEKDSELIIVEDDPPHTWERSRTLHAGRVRHVRVRPMTLGAKLNYAAEQARGEVFQKLDDDDWYDPGFLARGLRELNGSQKTVVAWTSHLTLFLDDMRLRTCDQLAGGTLCFHRSLWERAPFRDAPRAIDRGFLEDAKVLVSEVADSLYLYCMIRHGRNTWASVDPWYRNKPVFLGSLEALMPPEDRAFYERYRSNLKSEARAVC